MFEILGAGPLAIVGTLLGLLLALFVHKFVPALADAPYLYALLIGSGFVVGLALDSRSRGKRK